MKNHHYFVTTATGDLIDILRGGIYHLLCPFVVSESAIGYCKEYRPPRHCWAGHPREVLSINAGCAALFPALRLGSSHFRSIKGIPPP